jgi:hypothetical protein
MLFSEEVQQNSNWFSGPDRCLQPGQGIELRGHFKEEPEML